jgi:hypothetical protein
MKNQLESVLEEKGSEDGDKKRARSSADSGEEVGGDEGGEDFVIPSLDNIPEVITKTYKNEEDGFFDILSQSTENATKFADMISTNKNLSFVYDLFLEAKTNLQNEILEQRKLGKRDKVDYNVSNLVFYTRILNDAYEFYSNRPAVVKRNKNNNNSNKKNRRRKGCKSCKVGNNKLLFPDNNSKYCGSCFIEEIVLPEFRKYEDKAAIKMTDIRNDKEQRVLWKDDIEKFENLCDEINQIMDSFTGEDGKVTHDRYNTMLERIEQAKAIITPAMLEELSDESGEYEHNDEEEGNGERESNHEDSLPSDEPSAEFTGEEKNNKKKKKREEEEEEPLAHSVLMTMGKLPVLSTWEKMVKLYCAPGGTKRALLGEMVKDYNQIKEVYGIEIMNKETMKTCMHNTYLETREEADRLAMAMENGQISTKIIVKEV